MKKRFVLTFWLAFLTLAPCLAANFYFRIVDVKDGLADNFVRDIVRDSHGYIWLSTINGLSRYDGYRFHNYMASEFGGRNSDITMVRETADSTLWMLCADDIYTFARESDTWQADGAERLAQLGIEDRVRRFYVDDRHNLWVVTDGGVYHYDYARRRLFHIALFSKQPVVHIAARNGTAVAVTADYKIYEVALREQRLIPLGQADGMTYNRDSRALIDSRQNLWLYHSHSPGGTQRIFSLKTRQWRTLTELSMSDHVFVNAVAEDNEGRMWVGTGNAGIHVFSYQADGQTLAEVTALSAFRTRSSHIACFYPDQNNTMWVGSAKLGAAFTDLNSPAFNLVSTGDHEDVSALLRDTQGNLWVGFDGSGLMRRSDAGSDSYYTAKQSQLPSDIITSLALGADGAVVVGTYGGGIARFDGSRFVPLQPGNADVLYVKALATDGGGALWVATVDNGLVRVMPDGKTVHYTSTNSPLPSNGILCLCADPHRNRVYAGTSMGIAVYDCTKDDFIQVEALSPLQGNYLTAMMMCPHNNLWIGSRQGLWIYSSHGGNLRHLTTVQGLSHNTVHALAVGGRNMWASTDNGLTVIMPVADSQDPLAMKCFPFYEYDGLRQVIFSNNAALSASEGHALLGCYSGYVSIPQDEIVTHAPRLQVQFTDFIVNGQSVSDFFADHTISHDERLGIYVSAMAPAVSPKVKYYYRFKGDKEWIRSADNFLFFGSLRPGHHVLQVKAVLPGVAESEVAELNLRVKPPFWLSIWAQMLYLMLFVGAIYLIYRGVRRKQQRQLNIKQMEVNLEKYQMEEEKIRFFTNISHDIKTPLTLVMAPLEKVREASLPAAVRTEVDVAWRNARHLYDLVLQLLDFRRLDVGKERLNLKHGDIVDFVRQTAQGFNYLSQRNEVALQLSLPSAPLEMDFDENKLRRIITNLMSNAFKYNTERGTVVVGLDTSQAVEQRQVVLSVADTGIGIRDKRHIFDRFVQETHGQEQEGSGIGLHIVRQYVAMMGGSVSVADNQPRGSVFTVTLPVPDTVTKADEAEPQGAAPAEMTVEETPEAPQTQGRPILLVVEDNTDARLFLQRSLDGEYRVLAAANGKEALQQLSQTEQVDVIVSDVMMPEMDGIELFRRIKGDVRYSHIPVILLTAKSAEENIVEGLKEGVADYITKPYSLAVLRLRIGKILDWTKNVHAQVARGIEIKPHEITVSSLDEELIGHVIADIEAHISDNEYSVVQLSSNVGMTRGHLYKKLMAITGKSPIELIRIIKLKRGKSLLDQGKTNITEVADMVGYSPKQFGIYFKQMYDSTPSEYLRERRQKKN